MQSFYFCPFPLSEHISSATSPQKTNTTNLQNNNSNNNNNNTFSNEDAPLISWEEMEDLIKIAQIFCLVFQNHEMDSWWCFYKFMELPKREFGSMTSFCHRQSTILHKLLQIKEPNLTKHLLQIHANLSTVIHRWFNGFFSSILPNEVLIAIFEKLMSVSLDLCSCVALVIIVHSKSNLIQAKDSIGVTTILSKKCSIQITTLITRAMNSFNALTRQ